MNIRNFTVGALACLSVTATSSAMAAESVQPDAYTSYRIVDEDPMSDNSPRNGWYSQRLESYKPLKFPYGGTYYQMRGYCYESRGYTWPTIYLWMSADLPLKGELSTYDYSVTFVNILVKVDGKSAKYFSGSFKNQWLTFSDSLNYKKLFKYIGDAKVAHIRIELYNGETVTLSVPASNFKEAYDISKAACKAAI